MHFTQTFNLSSQGQSEIRSGETCPINVLEDLSHFTFYLGCIDMAVWVGMGFILDGISNSLSTDGLFMALKIF